MKASQKRMQSQHSAVEVRLNRALEEVERYRDALQKAKSDAKVRGCGLSERGVANVRGVWLK